MAKMIAYCGLDCNACIAYLATKADDNEARKVIARLWSRIYEADLKPEDINCLGCHSETGPVFQYCKICETRKCAQEKSVASCAHCPEYACEKLQEFFKTATEAQETLEELRECK